MENNKIVYKINKEKLLYEVLKKYSLMKDAAHDLGYSYARFHQILNFEWNNKIRLYQVLYRIDRVIPLGNDLNVFIDMEVK